MKFQNCPRCNENSYENLKTHSVCHGCNFNSVEGFGWQKRRCRYHGEWTGDVVLPGNTNDPVPSIFTREDYAIVSRAIATLPERERKAVYFRFWKNMPVPEIAHELGCQIRAVVSALERAAVRLKDMCSTNPEFSRYRGILMAAA